MGVDRNSHVGVFLIVDGEIIEKIKESVNTCSNEECANHKANKSFTGQKFCSLCASKIAPKIYEKDYKLDADRFLDELIYEDKFEEDELTWTDPMGCGGGVFIPNYCTPFESERRKNARKDKLLDKYDEVTDLTGINSADEIAWFKEKYSDLIKKFEDSFDKENVRVGWGLVEWYS